MDVVLEVFDTFFFDRIYAQALPIQASASAFDPIPSVATSLTGQPTANASSWTNAAGTDVGSSGAGWQFNPASQYLHVEPSKYAYMSRWDRDNFYRQCVSLYLVTWCVPEPNADNFL